MLFASKKDRTSELIREMVVTFTCKSNYMLHIRENEHHYSSNSEIYHKKNLRSA